MRKMLLSFITGLVFITTSQISQAKIHCKGIYQTNSIGTFASPYCEDNYLAKIARSYGMRVSNRQIRQNANKKEAVCRFIGHDIRVSDICHGYRSTPYGGNY